MRTATTITAATVTAATLAVGAAPGAGAAEDALGAADTTEIEHCVIDIGDGRGGPAPEPTCFATFAEAMETIGMPYTDPSELPDRGDGLGAAERAEAARGGVVAASSLTLGIHFDGDNRSGSSISVTGSDCGGGHTNLSSSWINRINSTWNGCAVVAFFDGYDKTGGSLTTGYSTVNLDGFRNVANSVLYGS